MLNMLTELSVCAVWLSGKDDTAELYCSVSELVSFEKVELLVNVLLLYKFVTKQYKTSILKNTTIFKVLFTA